MQLTLLKGKIHRATVTQCDLHYEGSISVDSTLLERAGILPHEQVDVLNITTGARFTTYAIAAPANGGLISIIAYARMDEAEAKSFTPKKVLVDGENRPQASNLQVLKG